MCDLRSVQRQHAADVPAGESEDTRLQCVEHGEQQMRSFTCSTSSWSSSEMSVIPSDAVMIVAVVEAMPLVVKMSLYGAASPVSRSMSSVRIVIASSAPVTSVPRKGKTSSPGLWECTSS